MRNILRTALIAGLAALTLVSASCAAPSIQKFGSNAKIDWTNQFYIAKGEGVVASAKVEPARNKAYLRAKKYAEMAAIANLLMAIKGTAINYEATGKDFMADATIKQTIEGFVRNVEVISESTKTFEGESIVVVEVKAPMFGQNAPGSVFLAEEQSDEPAPAKGEAVVEPVIPKPENVKIITKPDKPVPPTKRAEIDQAQPARAEEPYTSVIIDASGYKLDRCMSPKIRRQDGSEIWGTLHVDRDIVLEKGITAYVTSLSEARKNTRAGSNPLMIRACGRAGGRFYSDPVLSDADASLLVSENKKSGFLDKLNVIIVKDPAL